MSDPTFVLLHSPLVGPASWDAVREELHLTGYEVIAPRIEDAAAPYWRSYVDRAAEEITDLGVDEVVLVPHSGAGALVASTNTMPATSGTQMSASDATSAPAPLCGTSTTSSTPRSVISSAARST